MYDEGFVKRVYSLGVRNIILSWDTFAGLITVIVLYILTDGGINPSTANELLPTLTTVSASLFAIVLAGLAIITSFTDKAFVYAWKKIEEFDDMITIFQYNLYTPLVVLSISIFFNYVYYDSLAMIGLLAVFVYMVISLVDLVNFICKYGLQRGEFIRQQMDSKEGNSTPKTQTISEEDLMKVLLKIQHLNKTIEEKPE